MTTIPPGENLATQKPLVDPDPTQLEPALEGVLVNAGPFLPAKVRAAIYGVGTPIGAACVAVAPLVGGTIGDVLGIAGAAVVAALGATALSHVSSS